MTLPGMGELSKKTPQKTPEEEYVSNLLKDDFWDKQIVFLANYINGQPPIALKHIKMAYKSYVVDGVWDKEKFEVVLYNLISRSLVLSFANFRTFGMKYDKGLLPKINLQDQTVRTYQKSEDEISDEDLKDLLKLHF